jgi:hypothetical protein
MAITTLCARCGINEVPVPESIEEDPVCSACRLAMYPVEFNNDEGGCPGWGDSCGNTLTGDNYLCPDCTMGRMNQQSPRPNL